MSRGDKPTIIREKQVPPEGIAKPGMILMCHPSVNIGYRWVPKELRKKKEKWGFGFVREYVPGDEMGDKLDLSNLTPEQIKERANALVKLAEARESAGVEQQPLTDAEQKHLTAKKKRDDEYAKQKAKAEARGVRLK